MTLTVRSAIQNRPLWFFFPLAFLLSWYTWYLRLFGVHTSGGMNPLGVLLAGLIMSWVCGGRAGTRTFLSRIIRLRVAPRWYLVALLLPLAVAGVAAALNLLLGARLSDARPPGWGAIVGGFLIQFLFVALGEEPGWRGFALVELEQRLSAVRATLLLGAIWALWHLPLMGAEIPWSVVPAFVIGVFTASFVLSWIFNSTDGAVLPCMLLHATVDSIGAGVAFSVVSGASVAQLWWLYTLVWVIVAAVIVWRSGSSLKGWH